MQILRYDNPLYKTFLMFLRVIYTW